MSNPKDIHDVNRYLRNLSSEGLRDFGAGHVAYVKAVGPSDERTASSQNKSEPANAMQFVIFDADGRALSTMNSEEDAIAAIRYSNMQVVTMH